MTRPMTWLCAPATCCALALGACGGDDEKDTTTGGSSTPTTAQTAAAEPPVTFSQAKLEAKLVEVLNGSGTSVGGAPEPEKVKTVKCGSVTPAAGQKATCEASGALTGAVTVTFSNADGTKFDYKAELEGDGVTQESSGNATLGD